MPGPNSRKIATFNVNGITTRLKHLLAWLEREQPGVVGLQDRMATDEAYLANALEPAGYGAIWQGQRAWNQVALRARGEEPVESQHGLPGDDADDQSHYCVYCESGERRVSVFSASSRTEIS